jgi:two-component system, OmpR family, phosphate regulon sensor histidine kinase PhoR
VHRLSLKIAAGIALLTGATLFVAYLAEGASITLVLAATAIAGCGAFFVARIQLASRIELARTTLRQVRKHEFANLESAHVPLGDELNSLIWEVYRTGLTLEKEISEMRKMENYRREFLGNVSHELKTPIFAIQGFTETLLDGALEDGRVNRSFLERILRNVDRLGTLTRDLSEISRLETGDLRMNIAPFSFRRLAAEVAEALEIKANEKSIRIHLRIPDDLPMAYADRDRIRQVLVNLAENAIKYTNPGGEVSIEAEVARAQEIEIVVADTGIGVAPQDVPRLTERFYRVDRSRSRDQGGTGLGLAIVKHILNAHQRQLHVTSAPGEGSRFSFKLPVARTQGQERRLPGDR